MDIDYTVAALMFPAIPLMMTMYSNRFHTFSSLNKEFLKQYKGCMDEPDTAIIYFNPEAISHKKLEPISKEQVHTAFGRENLLVFTNSIELEEYLKSLNWNNKNLLMMSSGTFDGIEFGELII